MKLPYLASYLKYLWKGQDQHGLHSPFVYGILCECLQSLPKKTKTETYKQALQQYLNSKDFRQTSLEELLELTNSKQATADRLWAFVCGPHKNSQSSDKWNSLMDSEKFQITVDCWNFGLIFTKKDQEKEHFTLFKNRWR